MSFPTQPAFIHFGTWDDETRKHPAMKWMEDYTINKVDSKAWSTPASEDHHPDFTLYTSDGRVIPGRDAAWSTLAQLYAPFKAHKHDPAFLIVFPDPSDGYQMIGVGKVFFNIGGPGNAVKDSQGKGWDGSTPGSFYFHYVKDGEGFKLRFTKIFSDPSPALKLMLQAGALDGEALAAMLKG